MAVLAKAEQARAQQKAEQEALGLAVQAKNLTFFFSAEKKAAAPAQPSVSHRCLVSREIRDTERAYIEQLSTAIQVIQHNRIFDFFFFFVFFMFLLGVFSSITRNFG